MRFWIALLLVPRLAYAYRPFDGTDADVATTGEIELELGPFQATRGHGATSYTPGFVFNDGFAAGYELVVDADGLFGTSGPSTTITDVMVKHVLRSGVLQGGDGPSLALETGVLLPALPIRDGSEAGWALAAIISERFAGVSVHLNCEADFERNRDLDALASAIIEGPATWRVRPVAELRATLDRDSGTSGSVLAGAIWNYRDDLVFDLAVRVDRGGDATSVQIRAGLTWAFAN